MSTDSYQQYLSQRLTDDMHRIRIMQAAYATLADAQQAVTPADVRTTINGRKRCATVWQVLDSDCDSYELTIEFQDDKPRKLPGTRAVSLYLPGIGWVDLTASKESSND